MYIGSELFDLEQISTVHSPIVEAAPLLATAAGAELLAVAALVARLEYGQDHLQDCLLRNLPEWPGIGSFREHVGPTGVCEVLLSSGCAGHPCSCDYVETIVAVWTHCRDYMDTAVLSTLLWCE